jgi:putative ABC transport system ATP-binding protein
MTSGERERSDPSRDGHAGIAISLTGVTKVYSGLGAPVTALEAISLDIPAGQSLALTGRSGSGKSTLLHLIGGMDVPDDGRITLDGVDIAQLRDSRRTEVRRRIGFVFQRFHLLPALTAVDNVLAPVIPYRTEFDKIGRARELLNDVGLGDREKHLPSQLSGGEQQRVAIARAFVTHPAVLFADEPTGNLDTATGQRITDLLFDLNRSSGSTLVLVTHDRALAGRCNRVLNLDAGHTVN